MENQNQTKFQTQNQPQDQPQTQNKNSHKQPDPLKPKNKKPPQKPKTNLIEISGVNKFYGKKQALTDVSLTIHQGMFGLLGRNGAGKTTLMKTLAALHKKQSGTITVCGIPIEQAKEIRSITGYLLQDFSMYPSMTVEESLDYLGVLSGMDGSMRKKRAELLLKRVNLTEHRRKKCVRSPAA